MARPSPSPVFGVLFGLGLLTACSLISPETSFAATHPWRAMGAGRPINSGVPHDGRRRGALKPHASFDHTQTFVKSLPYQATQDAKHPRPCHAQSFCSDCRGGRVPMKPAIASGDSPDRLAPHRGTILTPQAGRKMDPSSCYDVPRRANNDKCRACHR